MIDLYNKDTNVMVGSITEAEMALLDSHLEKESDRGHGLLLRHEYGEPPLRQR